jgi:hypothetical protein
MSRVQHDIGGNRLDLGHRPPRPSRADSALLIPLDVARHSGMTSPGVMRPLFWLRYVPPFGFAKGDLDADGEACDAPCARCDQIEVGRDAEPRDCALITWNAIVIAAASRVIRGSP